MRPLKGNERLNTSRIVNTAWRLVDKKGIDALSTRSLADALGVKSASLYHHVANMQELYGLMTEHLLQDAMLRTTKIISWQDWFRKNAKRHRKAFMSHRDSGKVASLSVPSGEVATQLIHKFVAPLIAAGIPKAKALSANGALGALVLGSVLYEQHDGHRKMAMSLLPTATSFDYGVEAIIAALADSLAESKSPKRFKRSVKPAKTHESAQMLRSEAERFVNDD
jgi:TetR/AcrR family transcriptional regulator, tetracycline repressor protein